MQPSYLGCRFGAGTASRTCGFDISQTFRQTRTLVHTRARICTCTCGRTHVPLCICTVASSIYTDSLSHYARHFCSSYRKRYSLATSIPRISHLFLPLSLSLFLSRSRRQISGKPAQRRSKFWWIYGISNSYRRKRIWPLSGQTGKGRPCRGWVSQLLRHDAGTLMVHPLLRPFRTRG